MWWLRGFWVGLGLQLVDGESLDDWWLREIGVRTFSGIFRWEGPIDYGGV